MSTPSPSTSTSTLPPISKAGAYAFLLLIVAAAILNTLLAHRLHTVSSASVDIEAFPQQLGAWNTSSADSLDPRSRDILQLDRYIRRLYAQPGQPGVYAYIGYWKEQTGETQAAKHSPSLCLPANGWKIERLEPIVFQAPNGIALPVNRIVGDFDHKRALFYYWFFSGEDYYAQEWQSLARVMWNALLGKRTDGGIIELSVALTEQPDKARALADAEHTMQDFTKEFAPALHRLILAQ